MSQGECQNNTVTKDNKDISNDVNSTILQNLAYFSKKAEDNLVCTINVNHENLQPEIRTPDSPIPEHALILAATLVTDAVRGRHLDFLVGENDIKWYLLFHHWIFKFALYIIIFMNLSLALFEKPAVSGLEMPIYVSMVLEAFSLAFFFARFLHARRIIKPTTFWADKKNYLVFGIVLLTVIDIIIYSIMTARQHPGAIRWSRPLRPLFIVNFAEGRQIRRAFRNIRRTLPDIVYVLILFFFFQSLFTLMAVKLFSKLHIVKYNDNSSYFTDYFDSFFDLYVLVTTANNPDIMMPAYDLNQWYALFFIAYLAICLYIFMSIFLAVVYNNYKKHLKNEVKDSIYAKRYHLSRAFDLLKVQVNGCFVICPKQWQALMFIVNPKRSQTQVSLLWNVLDTDIDQMIGKKEFLQVADLLNVQVSEVKDRLTVYEHYIPAIYNSSPSRFLRQCVTHRFFRYFFDLCIVTNAVFIGIGIEEAEWFFLAIFSVEVILKIYTFGIVHFFSRKWNVFDFIVVASAILLTAMQNTFQSPLVSQSNTLDILLVLRVLRILKIVAGIEKFKVLVMTIMSIGPFIITYGGVIFVVYYMFSIIGMEIFGEKIKGGNYSYPESAYCWNPLLNGSEFAKDRYCNNNFNNIINSFVLLFELMVVNQWQVLTSGFVLVTNKGARLFFMIFHLSCVIIVLNIFTALVLEAFLLESSLTKGKFDSAIETTIKEMGLGLGQKAESCKKKQDKHELVNNMEELPEVITAKTDSASEKKPGLISFPSAESLTDITKEIGIKFHLSKSGRKDIEVLLQRMFEDEIDAEDDGKEIEELNEETMCKFYASP